MTVPVVCSSLPFGQMYVLRDRSNTKSARLKVPSERADLSHTGTCGVMLRSTSHLSSLTAIDRVARKPLGPQIEAAFSAIHHGLSDGNLHGSVCPSAHGIDDDAGLVVDQVVRIIGKERVHAWPCNPCRLRIGKRDFLGRLVSIATFA